MLEFLDGWTDFGFQISETRDSRDRLNADVAILSNQKLSVDYLGRLADQNINTTFIFWYPHTIFNNLRFRKMVVTGEEFVMKPKLTDHLRVYNMYSLREDYCPMRFGANEAPQKVGSYSRKVRHLACFMGSPYKAHWVTNLKCRDNIFYWDIYKRGMLSYPQRRNVYLSSKFSLAFHNDNNIQNSVISQRVYEGIAYGTLVLSDNPASVAQTDGVVEFIGCPEELEAKIDFYNENPALLSRRVEKGYEWASKWGTNRYTIEQFLRRIYS